nr:oxidative stress-induced growth inhibitor 2-like [Onthophagus taurus]XP_022913740.1 oxidative stress-induced growth inhibitor 2-like [Onthophagus taurus]
MRYNNRSDVVHKDVVIIGNGPSGISLSYMLDGNIPYVISNNHPDEMLSARLGTCIGETLVNLDLDYLSHGLEGRSTNPISLLLDSLSHPCADIGLEIEPLIEWRRNGVQIDHIVFGKGPPGGSWHSMDPHILTLSLGTWMALPGLKYTMREGAEKRAFASNVAKYYAEYVKIMNLEKYFENNTIVVNIEEVRKETIINNPENVDRDSDNEWVKKIHNETSDRIKLCTQPEVEEMKETKSSCPFTNALNFLLSHGQRKLIGERCCKRKLDSDKTKNVSTSDLMVHNENRCKKMNLNDRVRSVSFSCDYDRYKNTDNRKIDLSFNAGTSTDVDKPVIEPRWIVDVYDIKSRSIKRYSCNYLVLANGASDLPNRLSISMDKRDPTWLLHDVRSLEIELELYMQYHKENPDPVLIVGAGLSAADAIIATRAKSIPVIHLFRNKSRDLSKQLPENMYPEYHKVHQMMQQEGSNYPLYSAFPEYTLTNYSENNRTVTITSKDGKDMEINVSFAVVLIGSRPDLSFLPQDFKLGVNNKYSVDSKTNPININKLRHSVNGYTNLYAIGPIAGDHFVRFLPGGALAIVSDFYKQHGCC